MCIRLLPSTGDLSSVDYASSPTYAGDRRCMDGCLMFEKPKTHIHDSKQCLLSLVRTEAQVSDQSSEFLIKLNSWSLLLIWLNSAWDGPTHCAHYLVQILCLPTIKVLFVFLFLNDIHSRRKTMLDAAAKTQPVLFAVVRRVLVT